MVIETELRITSEYDSKGTSQAQRDLDGLKKTSTTVATELDRTTTATKKQADVFGKASAAIDKVTVKKKQLIGAMQGLVAGGGDVLSSVGMITANLGKYGLMAGVAGMALVGLVTQQLQIIEASKKAAQAFIAQSEAMKQMGYGAISYAAQLDEIIKKNREIGAGIFATGEMGAGTRVSGMVETATTSLAEQMKAQGKTHYEITEALKKNKIQIEEYAVATEAVAAAERELATVTGDDVVSQAKKRVLTEALITAQARQKDAMNRVTDAFGGLAPGLTSLSVYIAQFKNQLKSTIPAGETFTKEGKAYYRTESGAYVRHEGATEYQIDPRTGLISTRTATAGVAGGGGGGGIAKPQLVSGQVPGGAFNVEFPEWYGEGKGAPAQAGGRGESGARAAKSRQAMAAYGEVLQTTTGNAIGEGVGIGLTSETTQEKVRAFAKMFINVVASILAAIPGIGTFGAALIPALGSGISGALYTGGVSLGKGRWKPFAGGGAYGDWIGSPTAVLGSKGNAILGDFPGGELVANPPQLRRLAIDAAQAMGGRNVTYSYPVTVRADNVIGQEGLERDIDHAQRNAESRRVRGHIGGK